MSSSSWLGAYSLVNFRVTNDIFPGAALVGGANFTATWTAGYAPFDPASPGAIGGSTPATVVNTLAVSYAFGVADRAGAGSPEGHVPGKKGATYRRTDGASGAIFYVKETDATNTGWVPYARFDPSSPGVIGDGTPDNGTFVGLTVTSFFSCEGTSIFLDNAAFANITVGNLGSALLGTYVASDGAGNTFSVPIAPLSGTCSTTDGVTPVLLASFVTATDATYYVILHVKGRKSDGTSTGFSVAILFKNVAGVVTSPVAIVPFGAVTEAALAAAVITATASGTTAQIKVTGVAASTIAWECAGSIK